MNSEEPKTPAAPPPPATPTEGVDDKPLVGGEIHIRLAVTPGMITLLAAPVTVLVTMLLGWLIVKSVGIPVHPREMLGGAIANTLGGIMAAIPLFMWMKRGAAAIAQAGLLGIALRMGTVLGATLLACAPAWGLERMALVCWVMGFYFPMLMMETAVVAWLCQKARH